MSTHNICFYGEVWKIIPKLSSNTHIICSISGLWFPWPFYMFFEMRFDLGTLDSGERSLPYGLLVIKYPPYLFYWFE